MRARILLLAVLATGCDRTRLTLDQVIVANPGPASQDHGDPGTHTSAAGRVISLAASVDGARVYAGTPRGGIFVSRDSGATWDQLRYLQPGNRASECGRLGIAQTCLPPLTVQDLVVSPANPDVVIAAMGLDGRSTQRRDGIYRTTDAGRTWMLVFQFTCGAGGAVTSPWELRLAPDDESHADRFHVYATGECGVAQSSAADPADFGAAFRLAGDFGGPVGGIFRIAIGPVERSPATAMTSRRVFAGGSSGFFVSRDSGQTYTADPDPLLAGPTSIVAAVDHPGLVHVLRQIWDGRTVTGPPQFPLSPGAVNGISVPGATVGLFSRDYSDPAGTTTLAAMPPYYGGITSTGSGRLKLFGSRLADGRTLLVVSDQNNVSAAVGAPTRNAWRRWAGENATEMLRRCRVSTALGSAEFMACAATGAAATIHADPHAFAVPANLAMQLGPATDANQGNAFNVNTEITACNGVPVFIANDGGVFRSFDCGKTWLAPTGLQTHGVTSLVGLPRARSQKPALYYATYDNGAWYTPDGELPWRIAYGGDAAALYADPVAGDLVSTLNGGGVQLWRGISGRPPDLLDVSKRIYVALGFPPGYAGSADIYKFAVQDWQLGNRPMIQTLPGEPAPPFGDFVMVSPRVAAAAPAAGPPEQLPALVVWRARFAPPDPPAADVSDASAAWRQDGVPLPPGATILQASGGHERPTYYVGDRFAGGGTGAARFDRSQQGDHLWRSVRAPGGTLMGWDCIVPGPATPGSHDGACAARPAVPPPPTGNRAGAFRAFAFASDPYDPDVLYIADVNGIKLSTDGGATWELDPALSDWITDGDRIGAACTVFCGDSVGASERVQQLTGVTFVPGEPGTRFALGEAGVFVTTTGRSRSSPAGAVERWSRLLDPSSLACQPHSGYFDPNLRALYVGCAGRSVVSLYPIPASL